MSLPPSVADRKGFTAVSRRCAVALGMNSCNQEVEAVGVMGQTQPATAAEVCSSGTRRRHARSDSAHQRRL